METLKQKSYYGVNNIMNNRKDEDEIVAVVRKSHDYNKFKTMAENRDIDLTHMRRLAESFKEQYLITPIIVNENYEKIDGQHRSVAAEELGLPIYYLMIEGYGIKEVKRLNVLQKNWTKINYLQTHCANGIKPYLEFREFMETFPDFGFQACERILTGFIGGHKQGVLCGKRVRLKDFENGKLQIPNLGKSYLIAKKIMDFKEYYDGFNRGTFVSAMLAVFKSRKYDHKEMLKKLQSCPIKLQHCNDVTDYKMMIEDIYNYKRQKENKVSFRYE